jgi:hypothetical protein
VSDVPSRHWFVLPVRRVRMKALLMSLTMSFGILAALAAQAQAPASAPAGSTGLCKDGTYYTGEAKKGACRGHKGVKDWYGAATAPATAANDAAPAKAKSPRKSTADTASAAKPAATSAPAGATGLCKDGTYYSGESKKGACRGHKGVKDWYGASTAAAAAPPAKSAPPKPMAPPPVAAPAPAPTAAPAAPAPMPMPTRTATPSAAQTRTAAAGGAAGKVWVNTETKVYHCANDRYYGKTKQGEYMSEADAIAKGNHGSHGKSCAQ